MERNFTNENFERFLRQNADGLRMKPSDQVWSNISKRLNRNRRNGIILGLSIILLTSIGFYYLSNQQPAQPALQQNQPATPGKSVVSDNKAQLIIPVLSAPLLAQLPSRKASGKTGFITGNLNQMALQSNKSDIQSGIELPVTNSFPYSIADSYGEQPSGVSKPSAYLYNKDAEMPQTIESVLNTYKRRHKVGIQMYITPTVSYRKLSDNKSYSGSQSLYPFYADNINSAVTHKPDFGLELGMAAKFPISSTVKLRGGIQFNVNRYEIKTYNTSTQMATIRFRNGIDTMNAVTNYNNVSGYKSNWLENHYFQISAPIGVEIKLKGDERMQFGIATTIQPTYMLGDRVYLISTDYKNYAEVPDLVRRWNVNTNLETYVSYSTGHIKWQVGPQVRYQLLSSFVKRYPVKENLFDFGLKLGVGLNHQ